MRDKPPDHPPSSHCHVVWVVEAVIKQISEIEIMRLNQMRAFSRISATGVPGPEGSIQKIFWSELNQRFQQIAQELLGPYGQLEGADSHAVDKGAWAYGYLRTRGNTIEAGTSEIQRSIIGHFVLGLPIARLSRVLESRLAYMKV